MLRPFEILAPDSLDQACELLAKSGSEAAVYAGGTELLLLMKEGLVHYPRLVDIKRIPGIAEIAREASSLRIGAAATHRDLEKSPAVRDHLPVLARLESGVANVRVRAVGTLGGNLCFGEPHSDPGTFLLAWGAELELRSSAGIRTVPIEDFTTGLFETARRPDEILASVRLPLPDGRQGAGYQKFSLHERPTATAAAVLRLSGATIEQARVAAGSVGPRPIRVPEAETLLQGEAPSGELFDEAGQIVARQIDPVDDLYGSSDYKRHLIAGLSARALAQAAANGASGTG